MQLHSCTKDLEGMGPECDDVRPARMMYMPFPLNTNFPEEPENEQKKPRSTRRQRTSSEEPFSQRLQHGVASIDLSVSPRERRG